MYFKYEMNRLMALKILKARKGKEKTMDKKKYLCDYVNTQFDIKGTCVEVIY